MKTYNTVRTSIVLAISLGVNFGCSQLFGGKGKDDDDQLRGVALLALLSSTSACTLGGVSFTVSSGSVTCKDGMASGTGTLVAATTSSTIVSVEFTSVITSGGRVDVIGGASSSALSDGPLVRMATAGNAAFSKDRAANKTFNTAFTAPTAGASSTVCVEMHLDETDVHAVTNKGTCPTAGTGTDASAAASCSATFFNSEGGVCTGSTGNNAGGALPGNKWGLSLNNATISGVNITPSSFNGGKRYNG
ncbi:MAG: hypothetical protein K8S54_09565 [Spirochaetia bacterium]|nr:hypothetical protein [Spirochaetia bacterium]